MKKILLFGGAMLLNLASFAQLNGTYSVNSGAAASANNYLTVGAAVSDMMTGVRTDGGPANGPGVSGPVTVRLAAGSGPYTEQVTIGAIAGTSLVNTVRITGGPSMEQINFTGTTTADRHVVKLTGASYIQLDSLTLVNNDLTFGFGVHITNGSDYNAVTNCDISVLNTSTSANFAGVVIGGASATTTGDHGDYNLIQNNAIHGGYYGISYNGTSSTVRATSNMVMDNVIDDFYYYGIRCYMQQGSVITGNMIEERPTGTTSGYGIYNYYSEAVTIEKNNVSRFGAYGIYSGYNNTLGATTGSIANNFVGGSSLTTGSAYGIYLTTQSNNLNVYHNSVSLTSGNGRGIYVTSGSGNNIVNNSIAYLNSSTAYALYVSTTALITTVDYNNYYVPGSSNFVYIGAAYTPATFVGGGGYNSNSINTNPGYIDPVNDLHIGLYANLWDAGTNVGITEDYDGDVRPMAPTALYDIGADEHTPDSVNVISTDLLGVYDGMCPDSNVYIGLAFVSGGTNVLNNVPFTISVTGAGTYSQTVTGVGPYNSGDVDTVWFGPINTHPGGAFSVMAYANHMNDQNHEDDTLYFDFNVQVLPPMPVAVNNTVCAGTDVYAEVMNDGYAHIWYDGNGSVISYDDSLLISSIPGDTTIYAANANITSSSLTTTFANNSSCGGGNMFKVTALNSSIIIDSFDLNMTAASINVSLYYMVGDYVGNETNAGAWTYWEDVAVTSTGTGIPTACVPTTSLEIPGGQTYSIYIYNPSTVYTTAAGDFSNSDILIQDGTGLCGLFTSTNYPRTWNGTIHYRKFSCPSDMIPVTIATEEQPVVDLGADMVVCGDVMLDGTTNGATTYVWSTGGTTSMESITAPFSGDVILTASNASCAPDADTVNIVASALPIADLGADTYFCTGGNVVLDPQTVTAGASFSWNTGATSSTLTVTSGGNYSVTVTDPATSCTNADTIQVSEFSAPIANAGGSQVTGSTWAFTEPTATPGTTWAWDFGDGTGTSTSQNPTYSYTAAGSYTVIVTVTNSCGTSTDSIIVNILGLQDLELGELNVFPNPTNGSVYAHLPISGSAHVTIVDMGGRTVLSNAIQVEENAVMIADISALENGAYIVRVVMEEQIFQTRIVKK